MYDLNPMKKSIKGLMNLMKKIPRSRSINIHKP